MIPHKSFRLDESDRALLRSLSEFNGISQSDVLRMAIRNEARRAGIDESYASRNRKRPKGGTGGGTTEAER